MGNRLTYPEVDLSGKVALVTGGNTGIGYETAKALARLGAHTFIACRSKERAESAIERMKNELSQIAKGIPLQASNTPKTSKEKVSSEGAGKENSADNADAAGEDDEVRSEDENIQQSTQSTEASTNEVKVEYILLDLASFQSTKECVRIFKERDLPLHILVNNAAVGGIPYTTTGDNLEAQFQINHLGPMLFTLELLPILLDTAASSGDVRIVFVSSAAHVYADPFNADQLNKTEEQAGRLKMYSNSKLYNVMTGYCLQRRLQYKSITVSSVHPGYVKTELSRGVQDQKLLTMAHNIAVNVVGRTSVEGAATSLNCAVNPELNSQQHFYYDSCRTKVSSASSRSELFQEQLWEKSFGFLKDHLSPDTWEKYGPKPQEQVVMSSEGNDIPSAEPETHESKPLESNDSPKEEAQDLESRPSEEDSGAPQEVKEE